MTGATGVLMQLYARLNPLRRSLCRLPVEDLNRKSNDVDRVVTVELSHSVKERIVSPLLLSTTASVSPLANNPSTVTLTALNPDGHCRNHWHPSPAVYGKTLMRPEVATRLELSASEAEKQR